MNISGGGEKLVQDIQDAKNASTGIPLTANWFKDFCCLFLFDDVWCASGITEPIVSNLDRITNHNESKLVFTTRDGNLSMGNSKTIRFAMKSDTDAQKILLLRSCLSFPILDDGKAAFVEILHKCAGLPISLQLAGAWIGEVVSKGARSEGALRIYLSTGVGIFMDGSDKWMKKV